MSDSPTLRYTSALALALVLAGGCEPASEGESTVPRTVPTANPFEANGASTFEGAPAAPEALDAWIEELARASAGRPYIDPDGRLPAELESLDYDEYRSIRFRPEHALWRDEGPFQLQLFHAGSLYRRPVELYLVDDTVLRIDFDPGLFSYDGPASEVESAVREAHQAAAGRPIGFAGFRVHYPLNDGDRMDEVAVFLGASYFRLVGAGQVYGLSARGLAVDVAAAGPEEFPDFRAFWLSRPAPDADTLVVHALLDSPSVTGAYRFVLRPGPNTVIDVDARLFARTDVGKLGVAPLSSMFLFDPGTADRYDDFRSGVHDSDGLMANTARGEWIWRPLTNHGGLRVSSLRDVDPRGFGLAQRSRDFDDYLDLEARYHERPGAWIETDADDAWGPGGVELLEIPTDTEYADNIAAYWVPDAPFRAGEERRYRYKGSTFGSRLSQQTLGQVVRTRSGRGAASARRFVVDFEGGILDRLGDDTTVDVSVNTLAGTISDVRAERLPGSSGWRASFVVTPEGDRPPDLRLFLADEQGPVTETWTYVWYPEDPR
jgi:glucans biosynthesis protein